MINPTNPLSHMALRQDAAKNGSDPENPAAMAMICSIFTDIALAAGREILVYYDQHLPVHSKRDGSPVSEADIAAERLVLALLAERLPNYPVIAEEAIARGEMPDIGRSFILVDPLDGTREFLAHNDAFTINLALIEEGVPRVGVIYAPAAAKLWRGSHIGEVLTVDAPRALHPQIASIKRIEGAFSVPSKDMRHNPSASVRGQHGAHQHTGLYPHTRAFSDENATPDGAADHAMRQGDPVQGGAMPTNLSLISPAKSTPNALTILRSRLHFDAATERFLAHLPVGRIIDIGSSLKFCAIAEGVGDLYPRFSPTMEWDVAAGDAIVRAAGGCVLQLDGQPLAYGKMAQGFCNPPFIAWRTAALQKIHGAV